MDETGEYHINSLLCFLKTLVRIENTFILMLDSAGNR
jgi:hypothetical protein